MENSALGFDLPEEFKKTQDADVRSMKLLQSWLKRHPASPEQLRAQAERLRAGSRRKTAKA